MELNGSRFHQKSVMGKIRSVCTKKSSLGMWFFLKCHFISFRDIVFFLTERVEDNIPKKIDCNTPSQVPVKATSHNNRHVDLQGE